MPNINISLPEDLHKRLRIAAVSDDTTVKDLVLAILAEEPGKKAAAPLAATGGTPARARGGRDGKH